MSNTLVKKERSILHYMNDFIENSELEDVKTSFDSKKGTATISGVKDGIKYTTTMKNQKNGVTKMESQFKTNIGKFALVEQIKELKMQGYKQTEIAEMLDISQSLVSKYLKIKIRI